MHRVKQNSASYCQSDVAWARTLVNSILSVICPHARIVVLRAGHTCQTMQFACWTMHIEHAMQTCILRARQCILRARQCILRARQRILRAGMLDMHFCVPDNLLFISTPSKRPKKNGQNQRLGISALKEPFPSRFSFLKEPFICGATRIPPRLQASQYGFAGLCLSK